MLIFFGCNETPKPDQNFTPQPIQKTNGNYNPASGWQTKPISQGNVDSAIVDSIHREILAYQKTSKDFRSFLLIHDNKIIFEEYYTYWDSTKLNSIKSVTKSITALLVGKAIELKLIKNVDQTIEELFPDYYTIITDTLKRKITIEHLLTMSAGFEWNNFGGKFRSGWDLYEGNRHEYMITNTVMEEPPGEIFNYNSGLSHMLSGIITNESGMKTEEFAKKYLFDSLGISNYKWTADRNGYNLGNSELFLTSRDMAKIGLLVLQNGFWYNTQLIDSVWIKTMTTPQIKTTGIGEKYSEYYGYQWWTKDYNNVDIVFAAGYGGQYIFVIPKFDLVLVFTTHWQHSSVSFKPLEYVERIVGSFLRNND